MQRVGRLYPARGHPDFGGGGKTGAGPVMRPGWWEARRCRNRWRDRVDVRKKKKGRTGATIGGALIGGALGARRDRRERARCLEEREAEKDRHMQRQLDYDRQRLLQQEPVRKEIEEQRLYEEWKKQRLGS